MTADPAMIPLDGADAARMGISAARNPHIPNSMAYHTWHADCYSEMACLTADSKQAEQYRKIANRHRHMAEKPG